jgi:2,3-bisphosphoglycerate-independent phosphoglycerate mutase
MILLCIMDGFGLREPVADNAIAAATKPNFDRLIAEHPHTRIDGSAAAVGLPDGQMGNSEVGHLNLGSGRIVYQDISRIDRAIADRSFFENPALVAAMDRAASEGRALHLFGLVSDGCVHSSLSHLYALVQMAKDKSIGDVYLHAFMDGRDTPPDSGQHFMKQVVSKFNEIGLGKVSTVSGRYYAMDRDKRWERVEKAYRAMVQGEGPEFADPLEAIKASYAAGVTDEFILPLVITSDGAPTGCLSDGDLAVMFNFRADRVREISQMFLGYENDVYHHPDNPQVELVTMTNYDVKMTEAKVAFHPNRLDNILGEVLARAGKKQLRTAETEKYAHVTFFFNGGVEEPFEGEDRDLIPSPKVATYDLQPEMSSVAVTDNAVRQIASGLYDLIVLNYANCDMVGHTGDFKAAKLAVEAVDVGLGRLMDAVKSEDSVALITADHGNAEMMIDPDSRGPWTAHTTNLVPCVLYDPSEEVGRRGTVALRDGGILADIAPTILGIMELNVPAEMTGTSLIKRG